MVCMSFYQLAAEKSTYNVQETATIVFYFYKYKTVSLTSDNFTNIFKNK